MPGGTGDSRDSSHEPLDVDSNSNFSYRIVLFFQDSFISMASFSLSMTTFPLWMRKPQSMRLFRPPPARHLSQQERFAVRILAPAPGNADAWLTIVSQAVHAGLGKRKTAAALFRKVRFRQGEVRAALSVGCSTPLMCALGRNVLLLLRASSQIFSSPLTTH